MHLLSMGRFVSTILLLSSLAFAAQSTATPTTSKLVPREPYHYSIYRLEAYRNMDCEQATKPEPSATPNPILSAVGDSVVVSFIVGEDGRVYSAFLTHTDSPQSDREVLRAVRSWRFRPATCNGVPWEAEGSVGFATY